MIEAIIADCINVYFKVILNLTVPQSACADSPLVYTCKQVWSWIAEGKT